MKIKFYYVSHESYMSYGHCALSATAQPTNKTEKKL